MKTKTPFPDPLSLGLAIRSARKRARLSQQAVADHLQIARTSVVALEKDERCRGLERIRHVEATGAWLAHFPSESELSE
ncbi:MAG TPA: hypothetical protein VGD98_09855 [Ktedonobacteraceae bacterium]